MKSRDHLVVKEYLNILLIPHTYKTSKSRGSVVDLDDVVSRNGADSLHLYERFIEPFR